MNSCSRRHLASPRHTHAGGSVAFEPLLAPRQAVALAAWVAMQMCFTYALQMPYVRDHAHQPALAWACIGVISRAPTVAVAVTIAAHAAALAALYLALSAVRCGCGTDTRVWPTPHQLADRVAAAAAAVAADDADGSAEALDEMAASPPSGGFAGFSRDSPVGAAVGAAMMFRWPTSGPERPGQSQEKQSFLRGMALTMTPRRGRSAAENSLDRDFSGTLPRWSMGVIQSLGTAHVPLQHAWHWQSGNQCVVAMRGDSVLGSSGGERLHDRPVHAYTTQCAAHCRR